jgi:hypothetical protein
VASLLVGVALPWLASLSLCSGCCRLTCAKVGTIFELTKLFATFFQKIFIFFLCQWLGIVKIIPIFAVKCLIINV